eukprot:CAMPEP_0115010608 /NCGR_PEP_ID=MMETSP0216-20121206/23424_1 /TAXON_ID=223996 /ORGANISM="Protocruzia adherens, Strain Boccale" /LENGTH=178 /DNA_ID=CAMNT_0002378869 /DNA_START=310 /DNA_END=846 /DNA_ORIENTATION=+
MSTKKDYVDMLLENADIHSQLVKSKGIGQLPGTHLLKDDNIQVMSTRGPQNNCFFQLGMAIVGGGVLGVGFGFFMAALEFRDVDNSQKFATQVRQAYKGVGERSLNMGRSFARFGALFTIFQCPVEKVRGRTDIYNPVIGGCLTGSYLARNNGPFAIIGGCASMGAISLVFEQFMGTH